MLEKSDSRVTFATCKNDTKKRQYKISIMKANNPAKTFDQFKKIITTNFLTHFVDWIGPQTEKVPIKCPGFIPLRQKRSKKIPHRFRCVAFGSKNSQGLGKTLPLLSNWSKDLSMWRSYFSLHHNKHTRKYAQESHYSSLSALLTWLSKRRNGTHCEVVSWYRLYNGYLTRTTMCA